MLGLRHRQNFSNTYLNLQSIILLTYDTNFNGNINI
jgi:hypothetical protein